MRAFVLSLALLLLPAVAWSADEEPDEADSPATEEEPSPIRMTPEEATKVLALPLPAAGGDRKKEIDFFVRRQQAAFTAGNAEARIVALRRLVELTTEKDKPSSWASFLWRELWRSGNQTEAFELGEALIADRRYSPAQQANYRVRIGADYLRVGQLDKARAALAEAEKEVARPGDENTRLRRDLRAHLEHLRSLLLAAEGDLPGAEEAIRKAVANAQREVEIAKKSAGARTTLYDVSLRNRTAHMQRYVTILVAQGKNLEAEGVARYGIKLADEEKTGGVTVAYWYTSIANAKIGQRRYEEARVAAAQSIALLKQSGADASSDRMMVAQTYLIHALFGLERWAEADQVASEMRDEASDDSVARARADSPVVLAFLHLMNGRSEQALQRIERTIRYRTRNYGEKAVSTIEAKSVRAMVYQAQGQTRNALQDYAEVLESVFAPETSFADAEPAGLRGFILPHALRSYLRLVAAEYKDGKLARAALLDDSFRVADRLRASAVQQALIDSSARAAATNPQLVAMIRREQDQRTRMRELTRTLTRQLEEDRKQVEEFKERQKENKDNKEALAREAAAEKERAKARAANLKKQREALQAADEDRRAIVRDLRKRFPEYQALVNPKPPTTAEVAAVLQRDEAFVAIFPSADGTFVWAVPPRGDAAFHYSSLKAADVTALVRRMRKTLDLGEEKDPGSVRFDFDASAKLHAELIAPVWKALPDAKSVVFAATGPLGEIPFGVLVTAPGEQDLAKAPWLVRQAAVTQISTVAAFQALRQSRKRPSSDKAFAGFGDPAFKLAANGNGAPAGSVRALVKTPLGTRAGTLRDFDFGSLPPLPETRGEILAIAKSLGADPQADTYLGARANRAVVMGTDLSARRVVAFATHGLKPGDIPGLSRPALALAATTTSGEVPLLVLDDVMGMRLNADLVVLSACNTASDDGSAEEAFSGLARGFFFAGARSVLATHWAVETESAEQLVRGTFAHIAQSPTMSRAEALRRAQLELIDGKASTKYRHPFFWAPYALSGDPAR